MKTHSRSQSHGKAAHSDHPAIRDVWADNLAEAMIEIEAIVKDYPVIAMDTEFPGIIHTTEGSGYNQFKRNVNELKVIQIGMCFSNKV
ncbi:hypothetical protein KIPB_012736, partial [Kipferlia bialata]|eukprot:g12736.t1